MTIPFLSPRPPIRPAVKAPAPQGLLGPLTVTQDAITRLNAAAAVAPAPVREGLIARIDSAEPRGWLATWVHSPRPCIASAYLIGAPSCPTPLIFLAEGQSRRANLLQQQARILLQVDPEQPPPRIARRQSGGGCGLVPRYIPQVYRVVRAFVRLVQEVAPRGRRTGGPVSDRRGGRS
jgi:hypothetical protein